MSEAGGPASCQNKTDNSHESLPTANINSWSQSNSGPLQSHPTEINRESLAKEGQRLPESPSKGTEEFSGLILDICTCQQTQPIIMTHKQIWKPHKHLGRIIDVI